MSCGKECENCGQVGGDGYGMSMTENIAGQPVVEAYNCCDNPSVPAANVADATNQVGGGVNPFNFIINPVTGARLSLFSSGGKALLKNMIRQYKAGGATETTVENIHTKILEIFKRINDEDKNSLKLNALQEIFNHKEDGEKVQDPIETLIAKYGFNIAGLGAPVVDKILVKPFTDGFGTTIEKMRQAFGWSNEPLRAEEIEGSESEENDAWWTRQRTAIETLSKTMKKEGTDNYGYVTNRGKIMFLYMLLKLYLPFYRSSDRFIYKLKKGSIFEDLQTEKPGYTPELYADVFEGKYDNFIEVLKNTFKEGNEINEEVLNKLKRTLLEPPADEEEEEEEEGAANETASTNNTDAKAAEATRETGEASAEEASATPAADATADASKDAAAEEASAADASKDAAAEEASAAEGEKDAVDAAEGASAAEGEKDAVDAAGATLDNSGYSIVDGKVIRKQLTETLGGAPAEMTDAFGEDYFNTEADALRGSWD